MNMRFLPAKLLLSVVNAGGGRRVVEDMKRGGARGGTKFYGRGLLAGPRGAAEAPPRYAKRDVVLTLMQDEAESVIKAVTEGARQAEGAVNGMALLFGVPQTFIRPGAVCNQDEQQPSGKENDTMNNGFTMIISITNHGEAEGLMEVARQAGARGGTIINARGTGTEDDLKYFGISLVPEKELLMIICRNPRSTTILEALSSQSVFTDPGGGIIFTMAVDQCFALDNKRSEYDE